MGYSERKCLQIKKIYCDCDAVRVLSDVSKQNHQLPAFVPQWVCFKMEKMIRDMNRHEQVGETFC